MKTKEIKIDIRLDRYRKIDIYSRYMLVLAFSLVVFVSLVFMPFISFQQDIDSLKNINNNLENQLYVLEREQDAYDSATPLEKAYSNAYQIFVSQNQETFEYVDDIFEVADSYVVVTRYIVNVPEKRITVTIANDSETVVNAFLIAVYETYGVISGETISTRWITSAPERNNVSVTRIEVTFRYA